MNCQGGFHQSFVLLSIYINATFGSVVYANSFVVKCEFGSEFGIKAGGVLVCIRHTHTHTHARAHARAQIVNPGNLGEQR